MSSCPCQKFSQQQLSHLSPSFSLLQASSFFKVRARNFKQKMTTEQNKDAQQKDRQTNIAAAFQFITLDPSAPIQLYQIYNKTDAHTL